ncbi:hypothetical protein MASR1M29_01880 [Cloacibacterium normanense]
MEEIKLLNNFTIVQLYKNKKMKKYILPLLVLTIFSCKRADQDYDASGNFEADEILVTAEATGKILELNLNEGDALTANQNIGLIDGKGVELQKEQVWLLSMPSNKKPMMLHLKLQFCNLNWLHKILKLQYFKNN